MQASGKIAATLAALLAILIAAPGIAWAGMPSPLPTDITWLKTMRLTDSAQARLEAISFFVAAILAAAFAVRWLWNRLAKDFAWLPRLSYGKSLAVVAVWGLLFLVVLTMIATTREAMTPGSWRKVGMLYQVAENPASPADTQHALGPMQVLGTIAVGWIAFLCGTLPRVTVHPPAVVSGVVILVLFMAMVEGFGRWCFRGASRATDARPRRWHFRWTASIVVGVFLMFAVGYCAIGLARQTAWGLAS